METLIIKDYESSKRLHSVVVSVFFLRLFVKQTASDGADTVDKFPC